MTEYITPTTWEECARHKERGGRVQHLSLISVEWGDDPSTPEQYRNQPGKPEGKHRRRLVPIPTPDEPETAEGDGLREKVSKEVAGALSPGYPLGLYYKITDAVLAVLPTDEAMHDGEPVEQWRYDALVAELAGALAERDRMAALLDESAPPVPPWPGAVLSGLVDEDGEPTWLAQAGQVRGEQVRCRSDLGWDDNDEPGGYIAESWVEVRAPRAVPAPETERVNVWDALMNERTAIGYDGTPMELRRGQTILYTRVDGGGGRLMYDDASHPEDKRPLVAPDGTVEVLKDGDR